MGTYGLEGVIQAWEMEKITTEQAIGQILQLILGVEGRLRDLEHRQNWLVRQLSATPPASPGNESEVSGE
jgi:hypothetical protein